MEKRKNSTIISPEPRTTPKIEVKNLVTAQKDDKLSSNISKEAKDDNKSIIKNAFFEVFGDSKVHGVSNIFKSENIFMKLFWLILLLGGMGCCTYCEYL